MDNPRAEKVAVVREVRERLDSAEAAILTEYRGLRVSELAALRRALREAGGEYRIYKNTLARLAVRDVGIGELEAALTGPTAFVKGDPVTVARALRDFSRTNPNLVVKGGLLGPRVLSGLDATALADIPPRDVLLARVAGGLAAPLTKFAGLLQALPRNLAYGLKALIDQRGGVPEAAGVETGATVEAVAGAVGEPAATDASAGAVEAEPEAAPAEAEPGAGEPGAPETT